MKVRWRGLILVLLLVAAIVAAKLHKQGGLRESAEADRPAILLVADLSEANEANDVCAGIIHAVRDAAQRGISVKEVTPDSDSQFLKRYHILTAPTVVILDHKGNEEARFEGESKDTLAAILARLAALERGKQ